METKQKIKLTVAITCFTAITLFAITYHRRRRRHNHSPNPCYLENDQKPQSSFKRILADNSYTPFKHISRNKQEKSSNLHPYREEIKALIDSPQIEKFSFVADGEVDLEMNGGYFWVDKAYQLVNLFEVLSKECVFAVDTEQHSLHSFLGFTALLQISTQKEDYLVDTIALHDAMTILRPVFADPSICKVFHGADNDVIWLQRDFHIYVVNLFDTAKACEVLSKPYKSLAYLLETYCGVSSDKALQREDWRLRPLSGEMLQYARADAHYLLYIADCLVNELKKHDIENSDCLDDKFRFVLEASRRSNMVCLQLYTKEVEATPGDSAASSIFSRYVNGQGDVPLNKELVRRLCLWRDLMARVHDESLRYVLSDQAIVALASNVPKTTKETYDTVSESALNLDSSTAGSVLPSPSAVICSHLEDIYYLLQEKISNPDDIFEKIIEKHLGPNGSCPLSIYNYALLSKSNLKLTNRFLVKQSGNKAAKRVGRKTSRELFVQKFSCKGEVYHNCRIYASDGRLLCYCDRRKLEWYLRRDLAKLVDQDPLAIMLLFEPKGRPEDEDNDFYIQSKQNICVGCGEKNHYLRYRIIPSCYRVHFPEHLKSHRSHDIVLLCVDCHEIAHSAAEKHKRQIAREFGIPLFVKRVTDVSQTEIMIGMPGSVENPEEVGVSPLQLRTAAMALLRHGPRMPSKRREELTEIVMKFFGGREISEEDLERALLVGMSPHERRRVEKKRGITLKHSSGVLPSGILPLDKAGDNNSDNINTRVLAEKLEGDVNDTESVLKAKCHKEGGQNRSVEMDTQLGVSDKSVATGKTNLRFGQMAEPCEDEDNGRLADDISNSSLSGPNGTASHNYNHKLSLLGHGPHGKQVVDHLLKEYGEDGVSQFCQRWRQVFVEAIHPRFLPAGWDVMHSGRREFGEYSVYNPIKKATNAVSD